MQKRNHSITIILPIFIFMLFVTLAVSVILFAARIYERNVRSASENFQTNAAISYVTEKIHASDDDGAVTVGTFDGRDAIILAEEINGARYLTYIYQYDDHLCELFTAAGNELSPSAGSHIMTASAFSAEMESPHLISFSITDETGQSVSAKTAIQSGGDT